ncbi:MAG: cytochrome c oxidase assembly protein [Actinomycetota bacterium]
MSDSLIFAHGQVGGPWIWAPHADVWLLMAGLLAFYVIAVRSWGPSHTSPGEPPVSRNQVRFFALGVLALWIGSDWPIHEISESYLFSVHMFQHMIFSLIGPPLLLLGTPDWLARKLLRPRWIMAVMRRVTRPIPALLLFNGFLVFSHWPGFVNGTLSSHGLHFVAHAVLVVLALVMWWPVCSPLPELPRISPPAQMLYLFGQTIVPTVPASFLTFAEFPLYSFYERAPRLISGFSAVADQGVAGVVMKLGGGMLLWAIIGYLFFKWADRQEKGTPDVTSWQDLERELNKVEATK